MDFSAPNLLKVLGRFPPCRRVWVAYSGGLDSHVLLHAAAALRTCLGKVLAVHVDHGLNPASAFWSGHCVEVCKNLDVPIRVLHVEARAAPGESPEAAARAARYRAFREVIEEGDCLLTAQHQDDQAETFLLQLLRGAGPRGAAGMPQVAPFGLGWIIRPLLSFPRAALRGYAERHGLHWVDDPSNFDTEFDRNFLRHEITPRLTQRWPAAARTLSRAAEHNAEAFKVLESVAQDDLHQMRGDRLGTVSVAALRALDEARCRNVLRFWLREQKLPIPSQAQLTHIVRDVLAAAEDAVPCVHWPGAEIRRYRGLLYAMPSRLPHASDAVLNWDTQYPLELPGGNGWLVAHETVGTGLRTEIVRTSRITVRFRRGGERCRPAGRGQTHALKKLLQEAGVPPWERDRIPLIYADDRLAMVVGFWVCEPCQARTNEQGLQIEWQRDTVA